MGILTNYVDVTGPADATKAIITVYDIFGASSQTLQGADLISAAVGSLVLIPDWFEKEGGGAKGEVCLPYLYTIYSK